MRHAETNGDPRMDARRLRIYLNDHLAAAQLGLELAARMHKENRGSELGSWLERLVRELRNDRDTLVDVMQRLGVPRNRFKQGAAWFGEKTGRLKLNGSLLRYSPLSRLEELEGLVISAQGRLGVWSVVEDITRGDARLADLNFAALRESARRQQERLEQYRTEVAREAFSLAA